ncbi:hypothetical protein WA158_003489 [Blastocystis sp. Blastoise]
MTSISHLSKITSQICHEQFNYTLDLVGKNITHINTLVNTSDIINIPEFLLYDTASVPFQKYTFPAGNYSLEEFLEKIVEIGKNMKSLVDGKTCAYYYDKETKTFGTYAQHRIDESKILFDLLGIKTYYWDYTSQPIVFTDDYISKNISWYKIYMLRVYCDIINKDNDLISIPLYAKQGFDNTFALSDLSIPCIDGKYTDIQWEVYDQLNNPIDLSNTNLYIYFTAS